MPSGPHGGSACGHPQTRQQSASLGMEVVQVGGMAVLGGIGLEHGPGYVIHVAHDQGIRHRIVDNDIPVHSGFCQCAGWRSLHKVVRSLGILQRVPKLGKLAPVLLSVGIGILRRRLGPSVCPGR